MQANIYSPFFLKKGMFSTVSCCLQESMSHEQDERRYSIDCREGKPLTSETGQYACQQNPSRKKKKKKEGKENRAETLDRDFSVMS